MAILQPQAALEQAVANAIIAANLSPAYTAATCLRTFDGQPHPRAGNVFISVWYDGRRLSEMRTCLNEVFGVFITISLRAIKPYDQWVGMRDDMETRANQIRALIHGDSLNFAICRAADLLAGYDGVSQPVGFREALAFDGFDPIAVCDPSWWHAEIDSGADQCGIAQRIKFGKARRVQALATMA